MKKLISLLSGLLFGTGLILTGMYSPDTIIAGLKIGANTFRINLYLTFITALLVTFLFFQLRKWLVKPLMNSCYDLPAQDTLDWKLIVGALLFGIGWGLTGICPGPNLVGLGLYSWPFYWINFTGIIVGFLIARYLTRKKI
ncbi:DUF6691 family protein [Legionella worsleiensis]|uniref:Transmembrane protein n=1 Tax=Legionella worsleiensis TaxID=45076 RepID=A0A0W1AHI2_9GAMM|nr:DUF6691 family protein [Legionella worsleiensis]KTD80680.1 transmembrane protein [Legionella worsleiensis]STY32742.1 transmembrane protein [Legionella worsleiensis]